MKIRFLCLLSSLVVLLGAEVKVRVIDDQGIQLADATVTISFVGYLQKNSKTYALQSDRNGRAQANGTGQDSVFVGVLKVGYYEARVERLPKNKDLNLTVVLPRILNPRALFASDNRLGRATSTLDFPEKNVWLGYDFEVGDWVEPHGRGKTTDILFRLKNEFVGYQDLAKLDEEIAFSKRAVAIRGEKWDENLFKLGAGKWDAELEISFPGEKEGLAEETRFRAYSQLKLPHSAPEDGYCPTWRYTSNSYSPRSTRDNVGFFLRTRVRTDERGNITSAHYTKILGDFQLVSGRGYVAFAYYFNPALNDRNLEFDPKKNLFPPTHPGANVIDP